MRLPQFFHAVVTQVVTFLTLLDALGHNSLGTVVVS